MCAGAAVAARPTGSFRGVGREGRRVRLGLGPHPRPYVAACRRGRPRRVPTAPQACCATSSLPAGRRPPSACVKLGSVGRPRLAGFDGPGCWMRPSGLSPVPWCSRVSFRGVPQRAMPCSTSRRSRSLLRIWGQQVSAPHHEAGGCCFPSWSRGSLRRPVGAEGCCFHPGAEGHCVDLWGRGLLLPMLGQRVVAPLMLGQRVVAPDVGAEGCCSLLREQRAGAPTTEQRCVASKCGARHREQRGPAGLAAGGWRGAGWALGGPWVAVAGRQVVAVRIRSPPEGRPPSPHEPQRATSGLPGAAVAAARMAAAASTRDFAPCQRL